MPDLNPVFSRLRAMLSAYVSQLEVVKANDLEFSLYTRHIQSNGKVLFFGAVQIRKAYVSYHLMPIYVKPELLEAVSADLKKRMHGKSCFNFAVIDEPLFSELAALTRAGFDSYKKQGFV